MPIAVNLQADSLPGQPGELLAAAAQVAATHGWRVRDKSARRLEISTSPSIGSLGETVKVIVENDHSSPGNCVVKVSSTARIQALNRGRTENNVSVVLDGMRELAHGSRLPPPRSTTQADIKFCASCGTRMSGKAAYCPSCGAAQDS